MTVKLCPLFVAARASVYEDPIAGNGVACIGSRCAAWDSAPPRVEGNSTTEQPMGRCGNAGGRPDNFPDPNSEPRGEP